jgi:hypothetical protein
MRQTAHGLAVAAGPVLLALVALVGPATVAAAVVAVALEPLRTAVLAALAAAAIAASPLGFERGVYARSNDPRRGGGQRC